MNRGLLQSMTDTRSNNSHKTLYNLTDMTNKLWHRFYLYDVYLLTFYTVIIYLCKHHRVTVKPAG